MAAKVVQESETNPVERAEAELLAFFERTLSPMTEVEQDAMVERALVVEVHGKVPGT
jgi:hypothetical protein